LALLKEWRKLEATGQSLPAYCIFTDATLVALAEASPSTGADLAKVPGIGAVKIDKYGEAVLAILAGEPQPDGLAPSGLQPSGLQGKREA
jgi:DNA helicase-2/ATP-dependent DNA helicase PcrA